VPENHLFSFSCAPQKSLDGFQHNIRLEGRGDQIFLLYITQLKKSFSVYLSVAENLESGKTLARKLDRADLLAALTGCFSDEAFFMFVFLTGGLGIFKDASVLKLYCDCLYTLRDLTTQNHCW